MLERNKQPPIFNNCTRFGIDNFVNINNIFMKTETFSAVTSANTRKIRKVLREIGANLQIKYATTTNFRYNIEVDKDFSTIISMILKLDFRNATSIERVAKEFDNIAALREYYLDSIIKS